MEKQATIQRDSPLIVHSIYARYVRLQYHATRSLEEAQRLLERYEFDLVEGIAFDLDKIVVMHGEFVEKAERSKVK